MEALSAPKAERTHSMINRHQSMMDVRWSVAYPRDTAEHRSPTRKKCGTRNNKLSREKTTGELVGGVRAHRFIVGYRTNCSRRLCGPVASNSANGSSLAITYGYQSARDRIRVSRHFESTRYCSPLGRMGDVLISWAALPQLESAPLVMGEIRYADGGESTGQ